MKRGAGRNRKEWNRIAVGRVVRFRAWRAQLPLPTKGGNRNNRELRLTGDAQGFGKLCFGNNSVSPRFFLLLLFFNRYSGRRWLDGIVNRDWKVVSDYGIEIACVATIHVEEESFEIECSRDY